MAGSVQILRSQCTALPGSSIVWNTLPDCEDIPVLSVYGLDTLDPQICRMVRYVVFRIPFVDGVAEGDRVRFDGRHLFVHSAVAGSEMREVEVTCESLGGYVSNSIARLLVARQAAQSHELS